LKDMLRRKFKEALFLWRLLRARFAEFQDDFEEARRRLEQAIPTKRYLALRGAYDARLASISYVGKVVAEGEEKHSPNEMLRLIAELQTQQWYWAPRNKNERFAARYLDYLEAAVLGEGERRGLIAEELKQMDADSYFKQVLLVTC